MAFKMPNVPAWTLPVAILIAAILAAVGTFYYGAQMDNRIEDICSSDQLSASRMVSQTQLEHDNPLPMTRDDFEQAYRDGTAVIQDILNHIKEEASRNALAQMGQLSRVADNVQLQSARITESKEHAEELHENQRCIKLNLETILMYTRPEDSYGPRSDITPRHHGHGDSSLPLDIVIPSTPDTSNHDMGTPRSVDSSSLSIPAIATPVTPRTAI